MNVIITNKQKNLVAGLNIDIIKSMEGEFDTDELVSMFSNFYFGKMILDLTAIKNYKDIHNLQKLSMSLDMDKVILLLPATDLEVTANNYLSQLVSMGIYNFTTDLTGMQYLFDHPNTYKDVAHIQQLNQVSTSDGGAVSVTGGSGGYIIGVKNLTEHAGATTLIFMLKKELERQGLAVAAIELVKRDFMYFQDKEMYSTSADNLPSELLKHKEASIVLVDLNDSNQDALCNDVLYLLEPSIIRLNKLMRRDKRAFEKVRGRKLVLNMSLLNQTDINDLEFESKAKVFYNIPPLNDRIRNNVLVDLLGKMGVLKLETVEKTIKKSNLFDFFKRN